MYEEFLILEGVEHTSVRYIQYRQEFFGDICPKSGEISYLDG
jgi:hypothetical protein